MSDDLETIYEGGETAPFSQNETATQQAETQADQTQEGGQPEGEGSEQQHVPLAALKEERAKAKRYTEEVADLRKVIAEQGQRFEQLFASLRPQPAPQQQPQKAPEFWENPEETIKHHVSQAMTPLQQMMAEQREYISQSNAVSQHGQAAVDEALADLRGRLQSGDQTARLEYQRIMSTPHPYGALVDWHKQQRVVGEIGTDINAYREKLKAELRAEWEAEQQGQKPAGNTPGAPQTTMPSNFATARNVGSRSGPAWAGPTPLADIFDR
jgi:hypothetical protein